MKENEANLRKFLRKKYIFDNPKACQEKVDGAVFRLAYQHNL